MMLLQAKSIIGHINYNFTRNFSCMQSSVFIYYWVGLGFTGYVYKVGITKQAVISIIVTR